MIFTLTITFDNGEVRLYDMHDELQGDVFRPLRQLDAFQRVYIDDCGSIAWDLDPERRQRDRLEQQGRSLPRQLLYLQQTTEEGGRASVVTLR